MTGTDESKDRRPGREDAPETVRELPLTDELNDLRDDYPCWRIGTASVEAASGPGWFAYWARKDHALLIAFTVPNLRLDIEYAESHRELA